MRQRCLSCLRPWAVFFTDTPDEVCPFCGAAGVTTAYADSYRKIVGVTSKKCPRDARTSGGVARKDTAPMHSAKYLTTRGGAA